MLTKAITALVMSGALWVAGDAVYQEIGCPIQYFGSCCPLSGGCTTNSTKTDCCSTGSENSTTPRDCCSSAKKSCCSQTTACCNAAYTYCTHTGEIYEGCCCEIVDGRYRCLITGTVSDDCCCIPLE